jgi:hypothetical protein
MWNLISQDPGKNVAEWIIDVANLVSNDADKQRNCTRDGGQDTAAFVCMG